MSAEPKAILFGQCWESAEAGDLGTSPSGSHLRRGWDIWLPPPETPHLASVYLGVTIEDPVCPHWAKGPESPGLCLEWE
jgi:hypothetical protein